jgi:sorbitol-specific phosphotransferase system component IIC
MVETFSERGEALMRIIVLIISGIILSIWKILIQILAIINFIITILTGKRNQEMADLCEYWNTEVYKYLRYLTFVTNERPFPFSSVERMSKFKK